MLAAAPPAAWRPFRRRTIGTIAIGVSVFTNLFFVTLARRLQRLHSGVLPTSSSTPSTSACPPSWAASWPVLVKQKVFTPLIFVICMAIEYIPMPSWFKFPSAIIISLVLGCAFYQMKKEGRRGLSHPSVTVYPRGGQCPNGLPSSVVSHASALPARAGKGVAPVKQSRASVFSPSVGGLPGHGGIPPATGRPGLKLRWCRGILAGFGPRRRRPCAMPWTPLPAASPTCAATQRGAWKKGG